MATSKSTFQKRQKEMKRQEKQRMKAERRLQKKTEVPVDDVTLYGTFNGTLDRRGIRDIGSRAAKLIGTFQP